MDKVVIDGKADDWAEGGFRVDLLIPPAAKPKSVADHDARFRLGWNDKGLLVLVSVQDDKWVEHPDEGWLWRYDGVELFLGDKPGADMCQWAISPGMTSRHKVLRWKLHDHRKEDKLKKLPALLKAARRKTKTGYVLEVLAPWSCLAIEPKAGREVGFQIYVNDADVVDRDGRGPITNIRGKAREAHTVAEGYLLLGDPAYARWVKRRLRALFTVDTWIAMVHKSHCPDFDHTVGNVAAHMALAHDYLGDDGYPGVIRYPGTVYGFIGGSGVICGRHADSPFFLVCPVCRVAVCDGGDVPVS